MEIARTMGISLYTVQDDLKSAFAKANVSSRGELAALVTDQRYRPMRQAGSSPGPYGSVLFGGSVGMEVLLERDSELRTIDRLIEDARAGDGRLLLVEGVPGIGKSAVLGVLGERAAAAGFDVLAARGNELERPFSFGVARQLFERRLHAAGDAGRAALVGGVAADALPALGAEPAEPDVGLRALHGLYWLAANLAAQAPLALCVDDAHWADRPSLRFVVYAASRLQGLPLILAVAARPAEPSADRELLDELALSAATTVLRPGPLSAAAAAAFVGSSSDSPVAPEFSAACHRATGGNPLLLRELVRDLRAEGVEPSAERAERVVEFGAEGVGRAVRHRLRALGPVAVTVARAVAVLGDGTTASEVAALTGGAEEEVRAAAADLFAADVLVRAGRLAFVHPLVRAAVYQEISPTERGALHRRAAQLLGDASAPPERVASHLMYADPRGDQAAVEALVEAAARAARRGAPDAAAGYLRRALDEPPAPGRARAAVLRDLGLVEATARLDGFEGHLHAAIDETDDPGEAAELSLRLARGLGASGSWTRGLDVLQAAADRVDPASPLGRRVEAELLTFAQCDLSLRHTVADRVDQLIARFEAGDTVDPAVLGALSGFLIIDRPPAARAAAAAHAALQGDWLTADPDTLVGGILAHQLAGCGELAAAADVYDRVIAAARRRGSVLTMGWTTGMRSDISYRLGDVLRAEGEAREAIDLLSRGTQPTDSPMALWLAAILAQSLIARGQLDGADAVLSPLPSTPPPLAYGSELMLTTRAELRRAQGRLEEAIEDLRAAADVLGPDFPNPIQNRWRGRLAVVLAATGDRDEARRLAEEELALARRFGVALSIGIALTARGTAERGEEGIRCLEEAVALLEPTEGRLEHARALVELGAALRRDGSRAAAREPLRAGLDLAARSGASALADHAHAELVAAGARPRRDRRFLAGPESLTAGEYRVCVLVAEGLTNRQIAQRLYVTQAAVQWHLRNAFRKLGIASRGEMAAALAAGSGDAEAGTPALAPAKP